MAFTRYKMEEEHSGLYDENDILEAVRRFRKMIRKKTVEYFDIFEFEEIADYFMDEGRLKLAKKAISTGLHIHPSATPLLIKKAQILAYEGKTKECLRLINYLEKIERSNSDLYLVKGSALNLIGDTEKAVKAYEKAIVYDTEEADEILYSIGITFGQTGNLRLALHYLERAHRANPKNEMVLYELGYFYERNAQLDKSIEYYNKYLDIDPFNSSVWYNLGITYNQGDRYKDAIRAYDFAIALDENFLQAYFNKANTYSNNEQYEEAIPCYDEYIEHDQENDDAYCYLADCYLHLNQNNQALVNYQKALRLNEENAAAWYGSGLVMRRENQLTESHAFLKKATLYDNESDEYWLSYAKVCRDLDLYKEAITGYQNATHIAPENTEYWIAYSEFLHEKGYTERAINVLKKAEKVSGSSAHINYRLTAYLLENKNDAEAAMRFEKALNSDFSSHSNLFDYYPEAQKMELIKSLIGQYQAGNIHM